MEGSQADTGFLEKARAVTRAAGRSAAGVLRARLPRIDVGGIEVVRRSVLIHGRIATRTALDREACHDGEKPPVQARRTHAARTDGDASFPAETEKSVLVPLAGTNY